MNAVKRWLERQTLKREIRSLQNRLHEAQTKERIAKDMLRKEKERIDQLFNARMWYDAMNDRHTVQLQLDRNAAKWIRDEVQFVRDIAAQIWDSWKKLK